MTIKGKKKVTTTKDRLLIKGAATGAVTSVTVKTRKETETASGTAAWKYTVKLDPGKNVITVTAHGPDGDSAPAKVTVTRK